MRKLMYCLMVVAALSWLTTGLVLGQGQGGSDDHHHNSDRRLAELKSKLNLTADQTTKIQAIYKSFFQQNKDHKWSPQASQKLDGQIMKVLTPAQQTKYKQLQQERAKHHHHHHDHDHDQGSPTPSH